MSTFNEPKKSIRLYKQDGKIWFDYDGGSDILTLAALDSIISAQTEKTNTIAYPLKVSHTTSGTPAPQIGVGLEFEQECLGGNVVIGKQEVVARTVTAAAERSQYELTLLENGAEYIPLDIYRTATIMRSVSSRAFLLNMEGDAGSGISYLAEGDTIAQITGRDNGVDGIVGQTTFLMAADGDWSSGVYPTRLVIQTTTTNGKVEAMRIDSNQVTKVYGFAGAHAAKSDDYTVLDDDRLHTIFVTTGAIDKTLTLPTAADNDGRILTFKKVDAGAGNMIIDGEGAETIDGAATQSVTAQWGFITVQCDGTQWLVIAQT